MKSCGIISEQNEYPGVAKFGIALEWGSRGRWFESSHSDHVAADDISSAAAFYVSHIEPLLIYFVAAFFKLAAADAGLRVF